MFYGEAFLDDDGRGRNDIRIAAKVTKQGSNLEVDLSDCDPQMTSFVNSSHANTQARGGDGFRLSDRCRDPQELRRAAPAERGDASREPSSVPTPGFR